MKTLGRHLSLVRQLETERSPRPPPAPRSRVVTVAVGLTVAAALVGLALYAEELARDRLGVFGR